jgi:hypothetical protein
VFLPVYVSGAVLKFDRAGAVRAVVVQGAAGKGTVSVMAYTVLGFSPPLEQVGREPRA